MSKRIWNGQRGSNTVTPELLAIIAESLPTASSFRDICAITGLRLDAVRREAAPLLAIMKLQGTHPKCGCGRDRFHQYGCKANYEKSDHHGLVPGRNVVESERMLARRSQIIAMMLAGERFVDIDAVMGYEYKAARKWLRFLTPEQMAQRERAIAARGIVPRKPRAPYKLGPKPMTPEQLERRQAIIEMLVAGETAENIAEAHGFQAKSYSTYLRLLTPEQRQERDRAVRERRAPKPRRPKAPKIERQVFRPHSDALYASIDAVTPRWLSEQLRDDVISDVWLAVKEGQIAERDIKNAAKGFATRAAALFESKYGPRSLDDRLTADTDTTLGEMIEDPAALAAFDRLEDMQAGRAKWRKAA